MKRNKRKKTVIAQSEKFDISTVRDHLAIVVLDQAIRKKDIAKGWHIGVHVVQI